MANVAQDLQVVFVCHLYLWCPAHAHLETGDREREMPYFCAVEQASGGDVAT
jgi:hypothetical protein